MSANKVKFGLKNVHYSLLTVSSTGLVTFAPPVPIPGAVNLNLDAQGETNTFYADDMAYYVSAANNGYSGTLEMALIPDDFRTAVLKEIEDATDFVLMENAAAEAAPFALLFEFAGDQKAVRHVLYNCAASRPGVNGSTTGSTREPQTDSLSLTASPLADGLVRAKTTAKTPEAVYQGWYQSVWRPGAEG